jgi:hypothetical protein
VDQVRGAAVVLMLQSLGNPKGPDEKRYNRAVNADLA